MKSVVAAPTRNNRALVSQLTSLQSRIAALEKVVKPTPHAISVAMPKGPPLISGSPPLVSALVTSRSATVRYDYGPGNTTFNGTVTGIVVVAARITTGSIAKSTTTAVTLTWPSAFADTAYTPVVGVVDSSGFLAVVDIASFTNAEVVVNVINNDSANPHTGTLTAIAIHD